MPDSDWGKQLAFGGFLGAVLLGIFILSYEPKHDSPPRGKGDDGKPNYEQAAKDTAQWIAAVKEQQASKPASGDSSKSADDGEPYHNALDLAAQWLSAQSAQKMVNWTIAQIAIGFVGLVALGVSLRFTYKATNAAIAAAEAANKSAQATLGVELPRFVLADIASFQYEDHTATFAKLRNFGRTEAIITRDCLSVRIATSLPDIPEYKSDEIRQADFAKTPDEDREILVARDFRIPERHFIASVTDKVAVWIYGFVDYLDFLKAEHRDGFCAVWEPSEESRLGTNLNRVEGRWVQGGPAAYTYSRYKTESDK